MILWQLPPDLDGDISLLEAPFRAARGPATRRRVPPPFVVDPRGLLVLQAHETTRAWVSSERMPRDLTTTADLVYARFHELEGGYAHADTREELAPWVAALRDRKGFAFFNNDAEARAPVDATVLRGLLKSTTSASGAGSDDSSRHGPVRTCASRRQGPDW